MTLNIEYYEYTLAGDAAGIKVSRHKQQHFTALTRVAHIASCFASDDSRVAVCHIQSYGSVEILTPKFCVVSQTEDSRTDPMVLTGCCALLLQLLLHQDADVPIVSERGVALSPGLYSFISVESTQAGSTPSRACTPCSLPRVCVGLLHRR